MIESTISQLAAAATDKGWKVEMSDKKIGISYRRFVWHWFEDFGTAADPFLLFSHTYSQTTGKTKSGIHHKMEVEAKIKSIC